MFESVENISFNGIDLASAFTDKDKGAYFVVNSVQGRGVLGVENTLINIGGMDGAYTSGTRTPIRYLDVNITLKGTSFEDLRKRIERLNEILYTGSETVPIKFSDESDRTYFGKLDDVNYRIEQSKIYQATLTFVCPDPYKYGQELTREFTQDSVIVENPGTAPAKPIFELTAKQPVTFAMVSDGERYNMIGRPADVDEQVVDTRTLLFEEDGSSLNTWTDAGVDVDGGTVTGSFGTDGAGITVPNFGTGTSWHGPALIKEIVPVQDFEVKAHLQMRTTDVNQTSRVEVYLFDENMKVLGKMGVMDNTLGRYVKKGEGRIGPFVGKGVNYLISSQNYQYNWDYFFGMLRIRRIGREFEFYITRIHTNTQHVFSLKETYTDNANEYAGRLKYVQIHIATYGNTSKAYSSKFFTVSAFELSEITEDQTPYIAHEGDVFTFDHINNELLLNGEDVKRLKDLGNKYFDLPKGFTTLTVLPENAFDTKIRFKPRYR